MWIDELSTLKIMTFSPKQLTGNENSELEWNKIPKSQHIYIYPDQHF